MTFNCKETDVTSIEIEGIRVEQEQLKIDSIYKTTWEEYQVCFLKTTQFGK